MRRTFFPFLLSMCSRVESTDLTNSIWFQIALRAARSSIQDSQVQSHTQSSGCHKRLYNLRLISRRRWVASSSSSCSVKSFICSSFGGASPLCHTTPIGRCRLLHGHFSINWQKGVLLRQRAGFKSRTPRPRYMPIVYESRSCKGCNLSTALGSSRLLWKLGISLPKCPRFYSIVLMTRADMPQLSPFLSGHRRSLGEPLPWYQGPLIIGTANERSDSQFHPGCL